jgi:hypothetical protein
VIAELYSPKSRFEPHISSTEAGKSMKHPTPSDFIVNVQESHVSVIFKPSDSYYSFGRLADPEDIARHGPLSRSPNARHTKTGDTGDYSSEEVAHMAHTLAVKAVTSP